MTAAALSPGQLAYLAQQAGFSGPGVPTIVAVDLAESSGRPDALGDLGLQTDTWGPSVGVGQIRSLKAQYGTPVDDPRDQLANLDPLTNLRHQFQISNGGTDFSPWSTWWGNARARTGAGRGVFQNFLPAATAGAANPVPYTGTGAGGGGAVAPAGGDTSTTTTATAELAGWTDIFPWNWGSSLGKDLGHIIGTTVLPIIVNGVFYVGGVALVVLGVYKTADPGGSAAAQVTQLAPMLAAAA